MVSEGGNNEKHAITLGPYSFTKPGIAGTAGQVAQKLGVPGAGGTYQVTHEVRDGGDGTVIIVTTTQDTSYGQAIGIPTFERETFSSVNGMPAIHMAKEWVMAQHSKLYEGTAENRAKLDKAFGDFAQVSDKEGIKAQYASLLSQTGLLGPMTGGETADAPPEGALKEAIDVGDELVAQEEKRQEEVLTGMMNQCFYMENLEPFIAYVAAHEIKFSTEEVKSATEKLLDKDSNEQEKEAAGFVKQKILAIENRQTAVRAGGYGNEHLTLVSLDKPELLHNALLSDTISNLDKFQRGTPAMYSALVPQIKIFKIFRDDSEIQIPFSTHIGSKHGDITEMLESRQGRADDVGILGFNFEYEQGNVALATEAKTVHASLKLLFESVDSFTTERNLRSSKKGFRKFKFADLITEGGMSPLGSETKSPDEYRIRVVLGYGVPANVEESITSENGHAKEFFSAARKAETSLLLDTNSYDLEFLESGQMIVTFEYAASIEERLNYPEFNIFGSKISAIKEKLDKRRKEKKEWEDLVLERGLQPMGIYDAVIDQLEEQYIEDLNNVYARFKKSILTKVYKLQLTRGEINRYLFTKQQTDKPKTDPALQKYNYWNTKLNVNSMMIHQALWVKPDGTMPDVVDWSTETPKEKEAKKKSDRTRK